MWPSSLLTEVHFSEKATNFPFRVAGLMGQENVPLRFVPRLTEDSVGRLVLFRADAIQNLLSLGALLRDAQVNAAVADHR